MAYVAVDEFVDGAENILVTRNIVECVWTVLFYPRNRSDDAFED